jgi:hypothetical protein
MVLSRETRVASSSSAGSLTARHRCPTSTSICDAVDAVRAAVLNAVIGAPPAAEASASGRRAWATRQRPVRGVLDVRWRVPTCGGDAHPAPCAGGAEPSDRLPDRLGAWPRPSRKCSRIRRHCSRSRQWRTCVPPRRLSGSCKARRSSPHPVRRDSGPGRRVHATAARHASTSPRTLEASCRSRSCPRRACFDTRASRRAARTRRARA